MLRIGGQKISWKTVAALATESALTLSALWVATLIRFPARSLFEDFTRMDMLARFGVALLVCDLCLYYYDLYDPRVVVNRGILIANLLKAFGVACVALAILYYLIPSLSLGRGVAVLAAPSVLILIVGWRLLLEVLAPLLLGSERVLVLGTGGAGIALVRELIRCPEFNQKVIGFLDEKGENIGQPLVNPGIIGAACDVEEIVERENIDRVVIGLKERRGVTPARQLLRLKFKGISVEDAHSVFERVTGRIMLEHLNPSWLILSDGFRQSQLQMGIKRALDITVALVGLVLTAPLMVLVALAIRLESKGPVLFRQPRTGLKERPFQILKLRSMYCESQTSLESWTAPDDRRITRVGSFIRRTRLDELPQFFNVLRGEMSLVGPRPEQPYLCSVLEKEILHFAARHSIRPGITGWAQIKYRYGASVEQTKIKLEYDLFYIKHMGLPLDLAILFETAKVMLSGRGAH